MAVVVLIRAIFRIIEPFVAITLVPSVFALAMLGPHRIMGIITVVAGTVVTAIVAVGVFEVVGDDGAS